MVAHYPEHEQEDEESKHVDEQDDAFCERKMLGEEDVECDGESEESVDQERGLPQLLDIGVRVDQGDKTSDHTGELLTARGNSSDPAKTTAPADNIAERLLEATWSELAHPIAEAGQLVWQS